jgi:predicted Rossmann fold flavoprotein
MSKRIIIVGGGASGLLAAGKAVESGADVTIIEKMYRPGRKLRITGKGRCNLTNIAPLTEFLSHFGKHGKFLRPSFRAFFNNDLISLLAKLKVRTITEKDGRVFPASGQAGDVVDALVYWVRSRKVKIMTDTSVTRLIVNDNRFTGIEMKSKTNPQSRIINADSVIIAAGGKSYPATGSTGDGYRLAEAVGHTINAPFPALVPLVAKGDIPSRLEGVGLENIQTDLFIDNKIAAFDNKEVMFTGFGLSGPAILSLSKHAVIALRAKQAVEISIDLMPALDHKELDNYILAMIKEHTNQQYKSLLKAFVPFKMIPVFADLTAIPESFIVNQLTTERRKRLRDLLKDFRFTIIGHRDFNEAVITSGGVTIKEINPNTLESKLVNGLYFAGEVIDIDADTGGFNLQAAFSTGYLAGKSAKG